MFSDFFQKQFEVRKYIATPFGEIETVDIKPPNPKTSIPVFFAPGWRETPELQEACLYEVYKANRRVFTLHHARSAYAVEAVGNYPAVEIQKAKTLLLCIKHMKMKRVDVITHSEGAINVAIAATMMPEKFRNLVLVTPAGLHGKDSLIRLTSGFTQHMLGQFAYASPRVTTYLKKLSPRKRRANLLKSALFALQEGRAIASFDIYSLLINLRKSGVKVAVLVGEKDTAIPFAKIKQHLLKKSSLPNYGFDIFATKPGGHELYSKPEEVMARVEDFLSKLEREK